MSNALTVFQCYDGPGPQFGVDVSWMMARDASYQTGVALRRNGLVDSTGAPVRTIQEIALRPPSFDFEPVSFGSVSDGVGT